VTEKIAVAGTIGSAREIRFYDTKGVELKSWTHTDGKTWPSLSRVWNPAISEHWPGKEVTIPDGFTICGFRVWA
jgi:hypothetical protein